MHHQNYYKTYCDSFKKTKKLGISQQIDFVGKLEENVCATRFNITDKKKKKKTILNFSLYSLVVTK